MQRRQDEGDLGEIEIAPRTTQLRGHDDIPTAAAHIGSPDGVDGDGAHMTIRLKPTVIAGHQGDARAPDGQSLARLYSSEPPKPNRLSRLVNRLKIETYKPTVAIT